jgi:hypothetical protein
VFPFGERLQRIGNGENGIGSEILLEIFGLESGSRKETEAVRNWREGKVVNGLSLVSLEFLQNY